MEKEGKGDEPKGNQGEEERMGRKGRKKGEEEKRSVKETTAGQSDRF